MNTRGDVSSHVREIIRRQGWLQGRILWCYKSVGRPQKAFRSPASEIGFVINAMPDGIPLVACFGSGREQHSCIVLNVAAIV